MDGPTYAVRLRDLEERIDELKEQIRRSHTRLSLLSDTILSGGGAGSRASIRFTNELSSAFRVTRVLFVLDGAVQYNKTDQSGALAEQTEIPIFNGSVPPGDHTLQVLINLQGNGYGVFSYLRGYKLETYLDLVWKLLPKSAIDVASMDPMDYTPEERAAVIGRVRRALDRAESGEGSLAEVEQLLLGEPEALEGEVVKALP